MNDEQSLICHVAKSNSQWKDIEDQEVLVTFQGAHDYVSPSWYETAGVPTWNYQAVHIYGKSRLITYGNKRRLHLPYPIETKRNINYSVPQ